VQDRRIFDFLVIGAQKCGTTWLHYVLEQHNDIFMPRKKELHYFNHLANFKKGAAWYENELTPPSKDNIVGEATPNYFWNYLLPEETQMPNHLTEIAPKVKDLNPNARLIVALRDPTERAISAYYHHMRMGHVDPRSDIMDNLYRFGILSAGLYSRPLQHWLRHFEQEQICTLIFERDIADRAAQQRTISRVFEHLGLSSPSDIATDETKNQRSSYFSLWSSAYISPVSFSGKVIRQVSRRILPKDIDKRFKPVIRAEAKAELRDYYRPFNAELSEMIDIDVTRWWA
jgi:hypothetical protein